MKYLTLLLLLVACSKEPAPLIPLKMISEGCYYVSLTVDNNRCDFQTCRLWERELGFESDLVSLKVYAWKDSVLIILDSDSLRIAPGESGEIIKQFK